MKQHIYKIIILGIALVTNYSCSDSYIDVPLKAENSEDFFNSQEDYENALVGAYDLLATTYMNALLGEIASDNTLSGGESATDVTSIQEIDDMTHSPVNGVLRDIWTWMYAGANRACFIIEFEDKIDFEGKENIIAQAKFLRAYYYFELLKWFGDIPISKEGRIRFGDQYEIDRTPKSEVYTFLESDLSYAVENLFTTQQNIGYATKGAAQALLGKIYLYQNKFDEAATIFDNIIDSGNYSLQTNFNEIFEREFENNPESIFEVQYSDKEGASFNCLQCSEGNIAVGFNGIRGYDGPLFDGGFSFNIPTQETYDAFEPEDTRREVTILDIEAFKEASGGFNYAEGYKHTGYFNRKYLARKGDENIGDPNLTNPNNYRAIRLADVLLMAAEAHNKKSTPDDTKAQLYLNQVRERAFGDTTHNISLTGSALETAIFDERRLELVGEGHRFFDLVRTGRAKDYIPNFQLGKNEIFPIPQIEIELAGSRWPQNPNY